MVYLDKITGKLGSATEFGRGNAAPKKHPERYAYIGEYYGFEKWRVDIENHAYVIRRKHRNEIMQTVPVTPEEMAVIVANKLTSSYTLF